MRRVVLEEFNCPLQRNNNGLLLEHPISIVIGKMHLDHTLESEETDVMVIGEEGGRIKVFTMKNQQVDSNNEEEEDEWKLFKTYDLNHLLLSHHQQQQQAIKSSSLDLNHNEHDHNDQEEVSEEEEEEEEEPIRSPYLSSLLLDEEGGYLYVGDEINHCSHVLNVKSGEWVMPSFGTFGDEETAEAFHCVTGMCFEKKRKWLLVVDCENHRIKICQ